MEQGDPGAQALDVPPDKLEARHLLYLVRTHWPRRMEETAGNAVSTQLVAQEEMAAPPELRLSI